MVDDTMPWHGNAFRMTGPIVGNPLSVHSFCLFFAVSLSKLQNSLLSCQGLTYPIARQPGTSGTTSLASSFEQSFLLYFIQADRKNVWFEKLVMYKFFYMLSPGCP